ncbi:MAG TPA: hypothetical protein VGI81_03705 [Tepidisphaeraceae bacterium]|jgi:hypothetical protein
MKLPEQVLPGIIRPANTAVQVKSNVTVCSNVFPRSPDIQQSGNDVAFRCRVRGAIALRDLVPPGVIDSTTGKHEIRKLKEADRSAAFTGALADTSFALLPEQVEELNAFRCIYCTRSTLSVWFEQGAVQRRFVTCMCQREAKR